MIRTLLVPLDGSPQGEQALPHACRLARQTKAQLVLVRSYGLVPGELSSTIEAKADNATGYLTMIQRRIMNEGLTVEIEVLDSEPLVAILGTTLRRSVDLIVMSTQGRSGLRHLFLGSIAMDVLRHAPVPVLLVRAGRAESAPPTSPYQKVLIPLDGTPFSEIALTYLPVLGCDPQEVVLLCAASPGAYPKVEGISAITAPAESMEIQAVIGREQTAARRYLDHIARQLSEGCSVTIEAPMGGAGKAIVDAASADGIDFIVMATHERKGLDRLVHGSVAHYVLHHATVPVLLLPNGRVHPADTDLSEVHVADHLAQPTLV